MLTKADVSRTRREAREEKREVVRSDGGVPGLVLRVMAPIQKGDGWVDGKAAFFLRYRRPADRKQVRKEVAHWHDGDDAAKLAEVRKIAGQWYDDLRRGIDPAVREEQEREATEKIKRETGKTLREAHDAFMRRIAEKDRDEGEEVGRDFHLYILPAWGSRPIAEIRRSEIAALLGRVADGNVPHPDEPERMIGTPQMAKRVHKNLSRLFHFHAACDDAFVSPLVNGMGDAIGLPTVKDVQRSRALCARDDRETDDEIVVLWRATAEPTTFNAVVRASLLTGQRIWSEVAAMRRADIDDKGVWHIDPDRYKTEIKHEVPLPPYTLAFIHSQPVHREGQEWVFSRDGTSHPVKTVHIKAKHKLDARMLAELRKLAETRGADPRKVVLRPWQLRDLRRTARTLISRPHLGIAPHVREVVLGHVLPTIFGTYDVHSYTDEKRDALAKLAAEIERIVAGDVERLNAA